MKCIKYKSNEEVKRVKDEEAARIVAAGAAHYVPKHTWKAFCGDRRAEIISIARENLIERLPERAAASTIRLAKKAEERKTRQKRREEHRRKQYARAA